MLLLVREDKEDEGRGVKGGSNSFLRSMRLLVIYNASPIRLTGGNDICRCCTRTSPSTFTWRRQLL